MVTPSPMRYVTRWPNAVLTASRGTALSRSSIPALSMRSVDGTASETSAVRAGPEENEALMRLKGVLVGVAEALDAKESVDSATAAMPPMMGIG
ncbi:hypothetical protein CMMCAS02_03465 [Clavibacter michiganensis subsp. michiganensis]|nr:hypothetical protein CMMCAS02_03465 [Clavibacter michiganensis subsp. michiganensis]SLJ87900.1 hypothetical protein SAMN06265879_0511 [Clavibacter michiganensis]OUD93099.1 hypothetical protein CMMCAS03_05715 [Clavibacter michiganensis subsp. michiganensis]OUD98892.1 hypothetical protein CMMCAS06_11915 [Clavibacter michiganensis subsp. michiganensis]OUE05684.1 hypothetical protein CMMCAS08_02795 [Clavibacter michiganensis subsp. michiganensis]